MRLLLSTASLPDGSPEELRRAGLRHGFAGFEVDVSHELHPTDSMCDIAGSGPGDVAWYRLPPGLSEHLLMLRASQAHAAGAGILVREIPPAPLGVPTAIECRATRHSCECAPVGRFAIQPCWKLSVDELPDREQLRMLLSYESTRPVHIRLAGAGPEIMGLDDEAAAMNLGRFFSDLAMLGYRETLALVPSTEGALPAWRRWLLDERGWGCGSAAEKQRRRLQRQAT